MRAVKIARSVGRPSRLKNPPGILPAAYMRSSTSTVSGKKSAPSRASCLPIAVASTIVSPLRTTTAPSACFAIFPVSKLISRPPTVTLASAWRSVGIAISCPPLCFCGRVGTRVSVVDDARSNLQSPWLSGLPAQPEFLDQCSIPLQILFLKVIQEPPPAADELQQPAARVVVLRMCAQMLRQVVDAPRQQCDLDVRGARVAVVRSVRANDLLLRFLRETHVTSVSSVAASVGS